MLYLLSFGCGAALGFMLSKFNLAKPIDDDEWWNADLAATWDAIDAEERIAALENQLAARIEDLKAALAENRDLRVDIEIKRKKLEDAGL